MLDHISQIKLLYENIDFSLIDEVDFARFIIPKDLCDSRVYKQAGNSVSVEVIYRIAKEIVRALNEKC